MSDDNSEILHKKRLRNKGALIGAGVGAVAGGAANYFRKNKDERSAKDALIGAGVGAAAGGGVGAGVGHHVGHRDVELANALDTSDDRFIEKLDKKRFSDRRVINAMNRLHDTASIMDRKETMEHVKNMLKNRK